MTLGDMVFVMPPWYQGQIVQASFARVGRRIARRIDDLSDRSVQYDWGWASDTCGPYGSPGIRGGRGGWKPLVVVEGRIVLGVIA